MLVQVGAADKDENDTGHIVLQPPEHAWQCGHTVRYIARPDTDPGRFSGVKHSSHAGERSGSDGVVLGGAWRQELDVGDAEDDGG